uniref:insulin-like growth factor-binding protein 2 n=1 Tax=Myxine glutinosa TaxID=7769 RepID=UPI00358F59B9
MRAMRFGALCLALGCAYGALWDDVPFRCPPCTQDKLAKCPTPPESACSELLRQPGCGCCPTCALAEGESCGVYTNRCGVGMKCLPRDGVDNPLHSLLDGQGHCTRPSDAAPRGAEIEDAVIALRESELTEPPRSVIISGFPRPKYSSKKAEILNGRNHDNARLIPSNRPAQGSQHSHRRERASCQEVLSRKINRISMQHSQHDMLEDLLNFYIPNCDKNGLYNIKQCMPSLSGQRGECWCVDQQTGQHIHDSPKVRGNLDCRRFVVQQEQEDIE